MSNILPLKLSHFVNRTAMYVQPVNRYTVTSFIDGYEQGLGNHNLTTTFKNLLEDKYKIDYSSDGWSGQIQRLSESSGRSWIEVFEMVVLELCNLENN